MKTNQVNTAIYIKQQVKKGSPDSNSVTLLVKERSWFMNVKYMFVYQTYISFSFTQSKLKRRTVIYLDVLRLTEWRFAFLYKKKSKKTTLLNLWATRSGSCYSGYSLLILVYVYEIQRLGRKTTTSGLESHKFRIKSNHRGTRIPLIATWLLSLVERRICAKPANCTLYWTCPFFFSLWPVKFTEKREVSLKSKAKKQ